MWGTLNTSDKASWNAAPRDPDLSPFHGYLAYSLNRIDQHRAPSLRYPAQEIATSSGLVTDTAIFSVRRVIARTSLNDHHDGPIVLAYAAVSFSDITDLQWFWAGWRQDDENLKITQLAPFAAGGLAVAYLNPSKDGATDWLVNLHAGTVKDK